MQTVNSIRSDVIIPPLPVHQFSAPSHKDGCRGYSSSASSDGSHCTANSRSSYLLDSELRIRKSSDSILKFHAADRQHEQNGHENVVQHINYKEHYNRSSTERCILQEPTGGQSSFVAAPSSVGYRRQRTWSPQQKHETLCVRTGSDSGMMRCYGNDIHDNDEEEVDVTSPPKITPVSGRLPFTADHPLVRPIPCKPIAMQPICYEDCRSKDSTKNTTSIDSQPLNVIKHNVDEGYASRDWQNLSSSSSASQNSFQCADLSGCSDQRTSRINWDSEIQCVRRSLNSNHFSERASERNSERGSNFSCSRRRGLSLTQTPSPSDSGVGELEAILREKDTELQVLRDTMERNELAIMQVFEEKKQNWEVQMSDVIQEWEMKLRSHQQKSFRTEQSLLLQIFKLQHENKSLKENVEKMKEERESGGQPYESVEEDLQMVRSKLDELMWEQSQMSNEITSLKSQLKNALEEASNKSMELISVQLQLKDSDIEIECKNAEIHRLLTNLNQIKKELNELNEKKLGLECRLEKFQKSVTEHKSSRDSLTKNEALKVELSIVQKELDELRVTLDRERDQWFEEKTKVINYQKHLQLNYIQMARKSKLLEIEVQQMSSELERHDVNCRLVTMDEKFC